MGTIETEKERAIKQELAFYRSLEKSAVAGVFAMDLSGNQIFVNQALCHMVGYGEHELLGPHPPYIYWPPEEEETIRQAIRTTIEGKSPPEGFDLIFMKKNDERFPVRLLISPLNDKDGQQTGWIANVIDMSERKRMEEALRESEERFRKAFVTAAIGKVIVSPEGKFLQVNPAFCRIVGYTEEELLSKTFKEITHPEDLETDLEQVQKLLRKETISYHLEKRYIRKDGPIVWILLSKALILDAKGEPLYFLSEIQDITEQKKSQASFDREKAFSDTVIEAAPGIFFVIDQEKHLVRWNSYMNRLTGRSDEELKEAPLFSPLYEKDLPKGEAVMKEAFEKGYAQIEARVLSRERGVRDFSFTARRFQIGNSTYVVGFGIDITDRKKAEVELKRSAEEIQDLYNNSPVGYHSLDKDGVFIRINDTELAWLGYSREEVLGKKKFTDLITPESLKTFQKNFPGFKERGYVNDLEFEMIRRNGSLLTVLISATAIKDRDGNYLMSRSTVYDNTSRKKTEDALRSSEERFRAIAETIEDIFWMSTPGVQQMLYISPAYERLWERSCESLYQSPQSFLEPVHPEDRSRFKDILELHRQGKPYELEYRIVQKSGKILWMRERGFPIRDSQGNLKAMTGVVSDITFAKHAEEAQRRLAAIVEYSDDAIYSKTLEGIINSWNAGAERIYGYRPEEIIGKPVILLCDEEHVSEALNMLDRIRRGEHVEHVETRRKRKDGSIIDVSLSIAPIKDEQGRTIGASTIARDVTRRKRLEEEIASARAEKERLEGIKNLSATFAHHIFNALAPVKGYAEMIQRRTDPADEKYEYAAGIVSAVDESIVLVNKLKEIESYTPTQLGGMTFLDIEKKS